VTSFMRCAPVSNEDQTNDPYDEMVADPLSDATLQLWNDTAKRNRDIFTEVFRPVPSNLVRTWSAYDVCSWMSLWTDRLADLTYV
jgi:phospholipase D1/2